MAKPVFPFRRILFVASVALYVLTLQTVYREIISVIYGPTGLGYRDVSSWYLAISWVLALVPALWLPIELKRPSQLLYVIFYFTIYIPPLFIMYRCLIPIVDFNKILMLTVIMFGGILIMGLSYNLPLLRIHYRSIPESIFMKLISSLMLVMVMYLTIVQQGQLNLTFDLSKVYDVRNDYIDTMSRNYIIGYSVSLLSGVVFPLFLALGLLRKRYVVVILSAVGYLFLYGIAAFKASFLFPGIALVLYYLITRHKKNFSIIMSMGIICALAFTFVARKIDRISVAYTALIPYRTFSLNSMIQLQYFDFFSNHEPTYLSHVKGFSTFIHYPYNLYLTDLIPVYYYGIGKGSNASTWSMDGLAGFGILGIVLISIFISLVFFFLDSLAGKWKENFGILLISYLTFSFTSTSFFTLLFSGGLLVLMMLLYFLPDDGQFKICVQDATNNPTGLT